MFLHGEQLVHVIGQLLIVSVVLLLIIVFFIIVFLLVVFILLPKLDLIGSGDDQRVVLKKLYMYSDESCDHTSAIP